MKTENTHFKSLDFWKSNKCKELEDVLDFSRCLEDTAFPIIKEWYVSFGNGVIPNLLNV